MYQVTVFLSRSPVSLSLPPLLWELLPAPAATQLAILLNLVYEGAIGIFDDSSEGVSFFPGFLARQFVGTCNSLVLCVIIDVDDYRSSKWQGGHSDGHIGRRPSQRNTFFNIYIHPPQFEPVNGHRAKTTSKARSVAETAREGCLRRGLS